MSLPPNSGPECRRYLSPQESLVSRAGFSNHELTVLATARYYFRAFAEPESQAWMRALAVPRCSLGEDLGARVAVAVLDMVREMRLARRTMFNFSNPECPVCANVLCETERHLMGVYSAVSRAQQSEAHAHALLLCEGHDPSNLLLAAADLAALLREQPFETTQSHIGFVPVSE